MSFESNKISPYYRIIKHTHPHSLLCKFVVRMCRIRSFDQKTVKYTRYTKIQQFEASGAFQRFRYNTCKSHKKSSSQILLKPDIVSEKDEVE